MFLALTLWVLRLCFGNRHTLAMLLLWVCKHPLLMPLRRGITKLLDMIVLATIRTLEFRLYIKVTVPALDARRYSPELRE
jgi:hypothetical protein